MGKERENVQKAVFLYKSGKPKTSLRYTHIRERLTQAQPNERNEILQNQRLSRYLEARELIEKTIHDLTNDYLQSTLLEFSRFVNKESSDDRLPTTILLKADVKAYVKNIMDFEPSWHTISIHSKECPNIKSTIKLIVNRFTENDSHVVSDRRLTYDFNVLIDWLEATGRSISSERLIVVVEDTDGFDLAIVRELIAHMQAYVSNGDLKLHLLLNLSVAMPLIEENLSQENIVGMEVQVLQGLPSATALVDRCRAALSESPSLCLNLGPSLIKRLRSCDVAKASTYLQYAILAHFAGNPLASAGSIEDLSTMRELVNRLPSVNDGSAKDPNHLDKLLDGSHTFAEISSAIPEIQVGGNVLNMVFEPTYRPLMEQALTDPRIYSESFQTADRMSVPASILYQLSRESSIYINIYDFYCAFKEMLKPVPNCSDWDRQSMAIFLETTASLKMMGILRDCKRKFECLEKVSWKGV